MASLNGHCTLCYPAEIVKNIGKYFVNKTLFVCFDYYQKPIK